MTTTVKVGYDKRCWASFEIADATEEEIIQLQTAFETDGEATMLLASLQLAGRLTFLSEDQDDNPEYFADYAEPSIVDFDNDI